MLLELTIRNIALIESLHIEFVRGFNVLTGETGAGKSIVVDCVNLALGGRVDRDMIRTGANKGIVEALFDISRNADALAMAQELGVDADEGVVCVSRELSRSGRNLCRIAGTVLPLATLRRFTALLVDVHGQHEHQALLDPKRHIDFLDDFGDEAHAALRTSVHQSYEESSALASRLRALMRDAAQRERLTDMLRFQSSEIESARLKPGEEEKLTRRLHMLESSEKVRDALELAYTLTYAGESGALSAQESLKRSAEAIRGLAQFDDRFVKLASELESLYYGAREAGAELQALREELNFDPRLLDKINERLELISRLERKYGATEDEVIAFGEAARERLQTLEAGDEQIAQLKQELKAKDQVLREACAQLSESRHRLAKQLEIGIEEQLGELGMARTRFSVRFNMLEKPGANGMDEIEFLISPNPGEPLKPLSSIASGGELSRIMLALKALALGRGGVDSMVFDEIDTGVSGRMAQVVGEKMRAIAREKQVLCVTHLPQIAALGEAHFLVEKRVEGGRTHTGVTRLDDDGRVRELARLVGGSEETSSSLTHARSMLESAQSKFSDRNGSA